MPSICTEPMLPLIAAVHDPTVQWNLSEDLNDSSTHLNSPVLPSQLSLVQKRSYNVKEAYRPRQISEYYRMLVEAYISQSLLGLVVPSGREFRETLSALFLDSSPPPPIENRLFITDGSATEEMEAEAEEMRDDATRVLVSSAPATSDRNNTLLEDGVSIAAKALVHLFNGLGNVLVTVGVNMMKENAFEFHDERMRKWSSGGDDMFLEGMWTGAVIDDIALANYLTQDSHRLVGKPENVPHSPQVRFESEIPEIAVIPSCIMPANSDSFFNDADMVASVVLDDLNMDMTSNSRMRGLSISSIASSSLDTVNLDSPLLTGSEDEDIFVATSMTPEATDGAQEVLRSNTQGGMELEDEFVII